MIKSILQQLSQDAKVDYNEQFDVFELELFLNEVRNVFKTDEMDQVPLSVSTGHLERDQFDASANISCDFHENEDLTKHCALSYVRRWFYDCCDYVCGQFNIEMVPGKHLPLYTPIVRQSFDDWGEQGDGDVKNEPKDAESDVGESTAGSLNRYSTLIESESDSE